MRTLRLIIAIVILCAALTGSGTAQKQNKKPTLDVPTEAWAARREAALSSLLDAWSKCGRDSTRRWCDIYKEQLRQMPLEDLIGPEGASEFKTRFTAAQIELVKGTFFELTTTGYILGDKKSLEDCKKLMAECEKLMAPRK